MIYFRILILLALGSYLNTNLILFNNKSTFFSNPDGPLPSWKCARAEITAIFDQLHPEEKLFSRIRMFMPNLWVIPILSNKPWKTWFFHTSSESKYCLQQPILGKEERILHEASRRVRSSLRAALPLLLPGSYWCQLRDSREDDCIPQREHRETEKRTLHTGGTRKSELSDSIGYFQSLSLPESLFSLRIGYLFCTDKFIAANMPALKHYFYEIKTFKK